MTLRRTLTILLSIACIAVYGIGLLLYERNKAHSDAAEWIQHSHTIIAQAQNLNNSIDYMVAVQRGYLLTRGRDFYTSYFDAVNQFDTQHSILKKETRDNSPQQEKLRMIQDDIRVLRQHMEEKILQRQQQRAISPAEFSRVATKTRVLVDNIHKLMNDFISDEQTLLSLRMEEAKNHEMLYLYALFIVSIVSVFVMVLANGVILVLTTRNKAVRHTLNKSEQDLVKTRERLELAMRGTSDGVFDWNAQTNDIYFSARFCEMLGYTPAEFPSTAKEFETFIHPDDMPAVWQSITQCLEGQGDYAAQFRIQHKDGSWRWHLARGATTTPPGEKGYRLVGAHTDITRQKNIEEHLRASNKELEEFTYIASHDLRAPLVNLKGFAGEIEFAFAPVQEFVRTHLPHLKEARAQDIMSAIDKDIPESISFIRGSVTKMEKLTRAILELSRVGRRKLEFEPIRTQLLVENCVKILQHEITVKNVQVTIQPLPDIVGDNVAIEQVFMNILDNALKYLDPNRTGTITISGTRSVSETIFCIQDNGRGIRAEDLNKVFELFKRAGNNNTIPGEGMGMAYVQTIMRRHGGRIWCTSTLDEGSSFYFSIPHHIEQGSQNV